MAPICAVCSHSNNTHQVKLEEALANGIYSWTLRRQHKKQTNWGKEGWGVGEVQTPEDIWHCSVWAGKTLR